MAHPSSSHRDRDDERVTPRERTHRTSSSHHHHRTISSTTLLLVLSLILAVLAVMLSLPSRTSAVLPSTTPRATGKAVDTTTTTTHQSEDGLSHSFWGYLTPGRSHELVSRESNVALRESEVARREAELLAGNPGGWAPTCPVCGESVVEGYTEAPPSIQLVSRPSPPLPTHTIIQEVIKEVEPSNPSWLQSRLDGLVDREHKISEREKEVGGREENVGKREADSTKRESWINEQISRLPVVEEEVVYDPRDSTRHYYGESRRAPPKETTTVTATETKYTIPPPAGTRVAARPTPEKFVTTPKAASPGRTQEAFVEYADEADDYPNGRTHRRWFAW